MSHKVIDYQLVQRVSISCESTDGQNVEVQDGYVIPVIISSEEVEFLLAEYNPESVTSPPVSVSRPLAKLILDALKRKTEEVE